MKIQKKWHKKEYRYKFGCFEDIKIIEYPIYNIKNIIDNLFHSFNISNLCVEKQPDGILIYKIDNGETTKLFKITVTDINKTKNEFTPQEEIKS